MSSTAGRARVRSSLLSAGLLFGLSLLLRLLFFQGFVLGDDAEEFLLVDHISHAGIDFQVYRHLEYRFPIWGLNLWSHRWLGATELAFFLPTVLLSASFAPLGFAWLRRLGYGVGAAFLGGLLVATAPFEIVLGTLRANDLILAWFLALGLLAFVAFDQRPIRQGVALAFALWLAFAAKLWALYALPALGIHYLVRVVRAGEWRGPTSFGLASLLLHGATAAFWKHHMGAWLPFLADYSATYPIEPSQLPAVLTAYLRILFVGSTLGTTLFGAMPALLLAVLALTLLAWLRAGRRGACLDRASLALLVYLAAFFLLLELFPTTFRFDRFYSVPRIFRYLAPLSFPMTLLAAKLLLDLGSSGPLERRSPGAVRVAAFAALVALGLYQAAEATRPGRLYRAGLLGVVAALERSCPPELLVEQRLGTILQYAYLRPRCPHTRVSPYLLDRPAAEYEHWLTEHERELPEGAVLVSGIGSYVHYGCPQCGFRLEGFEQPLSQAWTPAGDIEVEGAEAVRLWRLSRRRPEAPEPSG